MKWYTNSEVLINASAYAIGLVILAILADFFFSMKFYDVLLPGSVAYYLGIALGADIGEKSK